MLGGALAEFAANSSPVVVNTTLPLDVALTAQFSTSNVGNGVTCTNLTVEIL